MYDDQTDSLWHNLTGEPVVGKLAHSGIKLKVLPVVITTWGKWLSGHPDTAVLDIKTGFDRDYTPGQPYGRYFASPDTMFPVSPRSRRLAPKSYVFAVRFNNQPRAYPLEVVQEKRVVNDSVAGVNLTILAETQARTVRAYDRKDYTFGPFDTGETLTSVVELTNKEVWQVHEEYLLNPRTEEQLARVGGHVSYWFGWYAFYPHTEVYAP